MPILVSAPGRRYRFRDLEFWAERGLIHIFDFRGNPYQPDYKKETVREFLLRANGFNAALTRFVYPSERREHEQLVENMIRCCKEAQRQGRPDDHKTFEHLRAMRDKHLLAPGKNIQAGNYARN